MSEKQVATLDTLANKVKTAENKSERKKARNKIANLEAQRSSHTLHLARQLETLTGLESRLTILGHLQRGGTPSASDRLLATRLGSACADLIVAGVHGIMIAARGEGTLAVPLEEVAGQRKVVPIDHPWLENARRVGTCLGKA